MDHGPVLAAGPRRAALPAVQLDQAIFSSLPSPVARGYRIVAASAGLSADERRELVQCAPSHGALVEEGAEATALAGFTLRSGRHAVFLTRHAGLEQSARGGFRVHTHVLLLTPADLHAFENNITRVVAAAAPVLAKHADWLTRPPARLGALSLAVTPGAAAAVAAAHAAGLRSILAGLLTGSRLLVLDAPDAPAALAGVLDALPAARRARVSFSGGLRFAPTRKFQLVFTSAGPADIERCEQDHEYTTVPWARPPNLSAGPASAWVDAAYESWCTAEGNGLRLLSDALTDDCPPAALSTLAELWRALRLIPQAGAAALAQLDRKFAAAPTGPAVTLRLYAELRAALQERRRALTPENPEGPVDG